MGRDSSAVETRFSPVQHRAMERGEGPSTALGIDVSERRGLDLVLLDGSPAPAFVRGGVAPDELRRLVPELRPAVVAVDAPSQWGVRGGSRLCEQQLRRVAIQSYGTPSDLGKRDHQFNAWMKTGLRVYEILAEVGYPTFRGGNVRGTTIEVFPHATSVVLAGALPPARASRTARRHWRAEVLARHGVAVAGLDTSDAVDAALAALTGVLALRGEMTALGGPEDGYLVVPANLAAEPYRPSAPPARDTSQPPLPGLSRCRCEDPRCRAFTSLEFAPGHDAKRKTLLWQRARGGQEALEELERRGWELPPEMRRQR
jgi:predicted RNase H-like nuclease